jgi:hypothetical protein
MANSNARGEAAGLAHPHWGAIWAGVFTFLSIWIVFGSLCLAIFAGSPNLTIGLSIWGVILTIIAMFIGARITVRMAGVNGSGESLMYGMIMFGLAITSALVVAVIGGALFGDTAINAAQGSFLSAFSQYGWALFVGLFLGWLAALGGATNAHKLVQLTMEHQAGHA